MAEYRDFAAAQQGMAWAMDSIICSGWAWAIDQIITCAAIWRRFRARQLKGFHAMEAIVAVA
jgi:hypothetical protein